MYLEKLHKSFRKYSPLIFEVFGIANLLRLYFLDFFLSNKFIQLAPLKSGELLNFGNGLF